MSKTKIMNCTCRHAYQDKRYGKGKRVHNFCEGNKRPDYRCTVCSAEKYEYSQ